MFVIAASTYLYQRRKREPAPPTGGSIKRWARDFAFVWILLSLLALYVVSVGNGSYLLFALGNIALEMLLILYVVRSGQSSHQTSSRVG